MTIVVPASSIEMVVIVSAHCFVILISFDRDAPKRHLPDSSAHVGGLEIVTSSVGSRGSSDIFASLLSGSGTNLAKGGESDRLH